MQELERRVAVTTTVEFREGDDDNGPSIEGQAAVFNTWSGDLGGFKERIAPGAFKDVLKRSDVRALFNHDSNLLLGRQSAKTLTLRESKDGLEYRVALGDTSIAKDVREHIKRGDIQGNSFSFRVEADEWDKIDSDLPERTITRVGDLIDVGPVTFPAYEATSVSTRSLDAARKEAEANQEPDLSDYEHRLRVAELTL